MIDSADIVFYVYILTNRRNGTFYIGMTNHLIRRVWEHKEGLIEGFTKRYGIKTLVYYETHTTFMAAATREKSIKRWSRAMKIEAIQCGNPQWRDLYGEIVK